MRPRLACVPVPRSPGRPGGVAARATDRQLTVKSTVKTLGLSNQSIDRNVAIEIHDSGPGLNAEAAATLFEPTITFKKHGMGLGLSIAKSHALLSGGDVVLIPGERGGAAFRVTLPVAGPQESA